MGRDHGLIISEDFAHPPHRKDFYGGDVDDDGIRPHKRTEKLKEFFGFRDGDAWHENIRVGHLFQGKECLTIDGAG